MLRESSQAQAATPSRNGRETFYPEKMKPEEMLAWYSARLPTVEINNTFYQMPKTAVLENWAKTTPEDFRFAIKASRRITHMSRLRAETAADSVNFLYTTLAALGAKRGAVLFQLPPFLKKDLPRLSEFLTLLPEGHGAAFEFRNDSWFDDDVYDALKAAGASLCFSEREDNAPAAFGGNSALGLCSSSAGNLLRRRPTAVGGKAQSYDVARDLRVLHARADCTRVCANADAVCLFVEALIRLIR